MGISCFGDEQVSVTEQAALPLQEISGRCSKLEPAASKNSDSDCCVFWHLVCAVFCKHCWVVLESDFYTKRIYLL